jgi:flagellar hook protein FlgE
MLYSRFNHVFSYLAAKNTGPALGNYFWLATAILFWISSPAKTLAQITPAAMIVQTGSYNDLAIQGAGYFILRDPETGKVRATRFGGFNLDANGYLVSREGFRLQGSCGGDSTDWGDVCIRNFLPPAAILVPICSYHFETNGQVVVGLADGNFFVGGQILLGTFGRPEQLRKAGRYLYAWDATAEPSALLPPATNGVGALVAGLEMPIPRLTLNGIPTNEPAVQPGRLIGGHVETDLGLEGKGFFILRDPANQKLYATRAGAYKWDPEGYLVHYSGLRVQGYCDYTLSYYGDIHLSVERMAISTHFMSSGKITVRYSDGTDVLAGQILLADCQAPAQLIRTDFSLYAINTNLASWTLWMTPEADGMGEIAQGWIEPKQFDESLLAERQKQKCFQQCAITNSTNPAALALNGLGFFVVRNPANNVYLATRLGAFQLSSDGYLVTSNGWRVQGLADPALTVAGDLRIDSAGLNSDADLLHYHFDFGGKIMVSLTDGSTCVRGQITLQTYRDPQALQLTDHFYYTNLSAAVPWFTNATPGSCGLANICAGWLEQLDSTSFPEVELPPTSGICLHLSDVPDYETVVEFSDDLIHWNHLDWPSISYSGDAVCYDTNAPAAGGRFYRTVSDNRPEAPSDFPTSLMNFQQPLGSTVLPFPLTPNPFLTGVTNLGGLIRFPTQQP